MDINPATAIAADLVKAVRARSDESFDALMARTGTSEKARAAYTIGWLSAELQTAIAECPKLAARLAAELSVSR